MTEKKPKENVLYVKGMHCSSCEILIEKTLLEYDQVVAADVSINNQSAKVYVKRGEHIDINELNQTFKEDGYQFSKQPFPDESIPLWNYDSGKLTINKNKLVSLWKLLSVVGAFLILFYLIERLQLGQYVSVDASSSLVAFFLLGLVAGVSSCAALIGGVLLSLLKKWNDLYLKHDELGHRRTPHILFHAGRFISFFLLGGILGVLGDVLSFENITVYAGLVVLVSLMMFVLALQMLQVKWAVRIKFALPKVVTRTAAKDGVVAGKYMPFVTGLLTFFLPCGFTLIAQGVALTTGSFWQGAGIMLAFALGTFPMLAGISMTSLSFTKRPHLTARFSQIAGLLILFFSLYNINGQLNVLGFPSLSDIDLSRVLEEKESVVAVVPSNGVQEVKIIAEQFDYRANGPVVFQAGIPTKLVVDNRGVLGCGAFIASRGLINNFIHLKPGLNTIDVGSPRQGSYKLTCSMGMVPPLTVTFR